MTRIKAFIRFVFYRTKKHNKRLARIKNRVYELEMEKQLARNFWQMTHQK